MTSGLTFFFGPTPLPGGRLPSWAGFRACQPNVRLFLSSLRSDWPSWPNLSPDRVNLGLFSGPSDPPKSCSRLGGSMIFAFSSEVVPSTLPTTFWTSSWALFGPSCAPSWGSWGCLGPSGVAGRGAPRVPKRLDGPPWSYLGPWSGSRGSLGCLFEAPGALFRTYIMLFSGVVPVSLCSPEAALADPLHKTKHADKNRCTCRPTCCVG